MDSLHKSQQLDDVGHGSEIVIRLDLTLTNVYM